MPCNVMQSSNKFPGNIVLGYLVTVVIPSLKLVVTLKTKQEAIFVKTERRAIKEQKNRK